MTTIQLANAITNFVFWSFVFACLAFFVNRKLGCLGLTIGIGGLMFSAITTLIGLLPEIEPTPFSIVPFPALIDVSSVPQPVLICLITAIACFTTAYLIERRLSQKRLQL